MNLLMKKSIFKLIILLVAFAMVAPSLIPVVSLAASSGDVSGELTMDQLGPEYTKVPFNSVEERINGSGLISKMNLVLVSYGYALYNDPKTGEVICLKLALPTPTGNTRQSAGKTP